MDVGVEEAVAAPVDEVRGEVEPAPLQMLTGDPVRPWPATTNQSGAHRLAWAWGRGKPVQP
ncbi:putative hydrolase [Streptomyces viridochromogenes Tue57]|uniref:Putative hydrolase n=1 Tax=Streptomyces viridochromogenes Tue57 TaxID=1160705 RepID=L8PJ06_STRVR|nr:putative hydrolase [Streptomyces viridochromogenes Tue57]